ncbi:MAG: helix-turn-helix domain-containing protein [Candidatus Omnitrophica bacterium]|nr:helix-turn-helix domain-containing protein [Candidatus Omnitrophota bacterium]
MMSTTTQYVSVRETAQILSISEKKVMDLIQQRKLQAYKIADKFLRLKKVEVLALRNTGNVASEDIKFEYTKAERIKDFFYYNDYYIISFLISVVLLYVIFYT